MAFKLIGDQYKEINLVQVRITNYTYFAGSLSLKLMHECLQKRKESSQDFGVSYAYITSVECWFARPLKAIKKAWGTRSKAQP